MTTERSFRVTEPAKSAEQTLPKENTSEVHQSIVEQFAGLPIRERLKMLHYLNQMGHIDADNLSSGKVDINEHYDKIKEIYTPAIEAEPEAPVEEAKTEEIPPVE